MSSGKDLVTVAMDDAHVLGINQVSQVGVYT